MTARGTRSNRPSRLILGKSRSSPILSLNNSFHGKDDSNLGNTTLGLYNDGLMAN
jgi:hypothetical protein